jgi:hypothetical protein
MKILQNWAKKDTIFLRNLKKVKKWPNDQIILFLAKWADLAFLNAKWQH